MRRYQQNLHRPIPAILGTMVSGQPPAAPPPVEVFICVYVAVLAAPPVLRVRLHKQHLILVGLRLSPGQGLGVVAQSQGVHPGQHHPQVLNVGVLAVVPYASVGNKHHAPGVRILHDPVHTQRNRYCELRYPQQGADVPGHIGPGAGPVGLSLKVSRAFLEGGQAPEPDEVYGNDACDGGIHMDI